MPSIFRPGWARRLQSLHDYCALHKLHGVVVSNPLNIRYLTGFQGSSGLLICSADSACLVTDGRYDAAVRGAIAAGEMAEMDVERVALRYDLTLVDVIKRRKFARVGFEAGHVTVATLESWRRAATGTDAVETDWVATDGVVEGLRIVKDAEEIALFRRAGPALAGVAGRLREWVRAGRTEREVARDIDGGISRAGFSDVAFPTIVASGPNSAHPHARPGDRRLRDGDLVVLDFGGVLDGYCVDLTRMAGIGQVGSEAMALVTAVLSAQREAIAAVRPGRLGADVDKAARSVLEAAGLGPAFLHGTGHGLGLEVHEAPRVSRSATGSSDTLQPGMVCTIEPGAYVEGLGGVRMEDDVLVTASGCEVLTEAPRDLLVV
jgi:Xaa-Pro aminopeptidase